MSLDFEEYLINIVENENRVRGNKYNVATISPVGAIEAAEKPGDSVMHLVVKGFERRDDAVVSVSNDRHPDAVIDAGERCVEIADCLPAAEAAPILRPLFMGRYGKQSYAFWPKRKAISSNIALRKIQLISINASVLDWLQHLGRASCVWLSSGEELSARYIEPVRFLIGDRNMPENVKNVAQDALRVIESKDFQAASIVQHGDFWCGNILLDNHWPLAPKAGRRFYVIDWGGASVEGYPFADLVRYLISLNWKNDRIAREIEIYGQACGMRPENVHAYVCASLGFLGMHRHEFPEAAYLNLCAAMIKALPRLA